MMRRKTDSTLTLSKIIILLLLCYGCAQKPAMISVKAILTGDHHSLQIYGFDKAIIASIGHDTTKGIWQNLLPVYKMPADTDMKDFQSAQPGNYVVKDSLVIFTPDTAFSKGQTYFIRCFDYSGVKSAWQMMRERKGLGKVKHSDIVFRY
jgi:hypothetical protein